MALLAFPAPDGSDLPEDIKRKVALQAVDIKQTSEGAIELPKENGELVINVPGAGGRAPEEEYERLSQIIEDLNRRFGAALRTPEGVAYLQRMVDSLTTRQAMVDSLRVNSAENARLTFEELAEDFVQDSYETNLNLFRLVNDHSEVRQALFDQVWALVQGRVESEMPGAS